MLPRGGFQFYVFIVQVVNLVLELIGNKDVGSLVRKIIYFVYKWREGLKWIKIMKERETLTLSLADNPGLMM